MYFLFRQRSRICPQIITHKKKTRNEGKPYYNFEFQTGENTYQQCVGFDKKSPAQISNFGTTGNPLNIPNVKEKEKTLFVNDTSAIVSVTSSDIKFQRAESDAERQATYLAAKDVQIKDVKNLMRTQSVNVTGTLTMGNNKPKTVTERDKTQGLVREDCIIEDETGNTELNIWDYLIGKLENGQSYKLINLTVKNYSGNTFLGTTKSTTFTKVEPKTENIKGPNLLSKTEQELRVDELIFVDKVNVS